MNTKRIIFQGAMIRAIQREIEQPGAGKTQTRRPNGLDDVNGENHPAGEWALSRWVDPSTPLFVHADGCRIAHPRCPYGRPGDLLYVRENLGVVGEGVEYQADSALAVDLNAAPDERGVDLWNRYAHEDGPDLHPTTVPSIFMPRWANRYTLLLTDVRVERLHSITAHDIRAEGTDHIDKYRALDGADYDLLRFSELWKSIHGHGAWDRNDWVWALEFRPIAANVDQVLADPTRYGIAQEATA